MRDSRSWRPVAAVTHTKFLEGQVTVDMRVVCPRDAEKMLLEQARTACWNRFAAKHECEELTSTDM